MKGVFMKGKILGGYSFTSKKGSFLVNITVQEDRANVIGVVASQVLANKESLPCDLKDMVGKTYIIDQNRSFASGFYEVK